MSMVDRFWIIYNKSSKQIWTADGWQKFDIGKSITIEGTVFRDKHELLNIVRIYSLAKDTNVEVQQYEKEV